ncbi:MAG: ribosome-associated translation inhibitor RaiA [Chloroflexota bacterium]|jgi:putative sigma-54 modulation protein
MELLINGHNMDVTPRLQDYVAKKTGRLDRYMPNLIETRVDLSAVNARSAVERQVAQVTIRDTRGTILRAEESSNDMFTAIDAVVDKLYRQIDRYRGRRRRKWRPDNDEQFLGEPLPFEEDVETESAEPAIVRQKRFSLRPMLAEEAVDQMELLGHDFFVFYNAQENGINVVYRRHNGDYGLLQPEVG